MKFTATPRIHNLMRELQRMAIGATAAVQVIPAHCCFHMRCFNQSTDVNSEKPLDHLQCYDFWCSSLGEVRALIQLMPE